MFNMDKILFKQMIGYASSYRKSDVDGTGDTSTLRLILD